MFIGIELSAYLQCDSDFIFIGMSRMPTFSVTVTEVALEAAATINERHVGAHVGLATVATNRSQLSQVNNGKGFL